MQNTKEAIAMDEFWGAAGSVAGSEHRRIGKNNQDAFCMGRGEGYLLGIVADGCGSCPRSEVGAWLGVELLSQVIAAEFSGSNPEITDQTVAHWGDTLLENLPRSLNPHHYYLFTLLGFVITPTETVIFGCGDGYLALNGEITHWQFANNAPPYLIYPEENLKIITQCTTETLQSLLIGTDGVGDWLSVESLAPFWEDPKYFKNPDQVRRSLAIAEKKSIKLRDDTTLITVTRHNLDKI